jgi:C4-dicarboxylate-specific signal transduction histidine kinase
MDKNDNELSVSLSRNVDQTVIQVRDNGSGIREEQLKRLFEPYFTTKKTGMGLGLVSTLNIIKSHEATIEVDSRAEVGTTFKVIFQD